ncbi:hypothetical protein BDZ89DRAFT_1190468 [Hymenopellis radicata]|nr:hypothetical protein BDZ89DRAFT_1190468 [Hymenopellis radicata]
MTPEIPQKQESALSEAAASGTGISASALATNITKSDTWFKNRGVHIRALRMLTMTKMRPASFPTPLSVFCVDQKARIEIKNLKPKFDTSWGGQAFLADLAKGTSNQQPGATLSAPGLDEVTVIILDLVRQMNNTRKDIQRAMTPEEATAKFVAFLRTHKQADGREQLSLEGEDLTFRSETANEATKRTATDFLLMFVVMVSAKRNDSIELERLIVTPTHNPKLAGDRTIDPETVKLDTGISVHVPFIESDNKDQDSNFAKILKSVNSREKWFTVFRHLMNISHLRLAAKGDVKADACQPPRFKHAKAWTGSDFYYLVIEYKKEKIDSDPQTAREASIRQLSIQMTSVLYFNAELNLSGTDYPIYGFLIEDDQVEVYTGWLIRKGQEAVLSNPAAPPKEAKALLYDLRESKDILCFYGALMEIRTYGCGKFYQRARTGVAETYAEMADPTTWPRFGKGYNPERAAEWRALKDAQTQAKRVANRALKAGAGGNTAAAAGKKGKTGGSSRGKRDDDEYTPERLTFYEQHVIVEPWYAKSWGRRGVASFEWDQVSSAGVVTSVGYKDQRG